MLSIYWHSILQLTKLSTFIPAFDFSTIFRYTRVKFSKYILNTTAAATYPKRRHCYKILKKSYYSQQEKNFIKTNENDFYANCFNVQFSSLAITYKLFVYSINSLKVTTSGSDYECDLLLPLVTHEIILFMNQPNLWYDTAGTT